MGTDADLLSRYAAAHDERAFGALVQRHLNLVYSVALRQVGGDVHLAQDVAQRVFADLARKAPALAHRATLGGWLYRAAQFAASDLVRAERARRVREQEAELMQELSRDPNAADGEQLRPVLDGVINELGENERDAVVLRFFEARTFAEIGATLRVTEDAARMRVERALEKLRTALARRGVTSTGAALAAVLANQVNMAAPAGLAASVTGGAVAGSPGATSAAAILMGMTKVQIGIVSAFAAACATTYVVQGNTNASLRREIGALAPPPQAAAALRAENQQLASITAEVERLRYDDLELKQLAQRVAEVRKANEERTRLAQAGAQDFRQRFYDRVRADDARAQQEVERMNGEGNVLVNDYKALVAKSKDAAQPPEARAEAEAAAQAKLEAIKLKQQEVLAFIQNVRKSIEQRVEAFRHAYGDDPNTPPPQLQAGTGPAAWHLKSK